MVETHGSHSDAVKLSHSSAIPALILGSSSDLQRAGVGKRASVKPFLPEADETSRFAIIELNIQGLENRRPEDGMVSRAVLDAAVTLVAAGLGHRAKVDVLSREHPPVPAARLELEIWDPGRYVAREHPRLQIRVERGPRDLGVVLGDVLPGQEEEAGTRVHGRAEGRQPPLRLTHGAQAEHGEAEVPVLGAGHRRLVDEVRAVPAAAGAEIEEATRRVGAQVDADGLEMQLGPQTVHDRGHLRGNVGTAGLCNAQDAGPPGIDGYARGYGHGGLDRRVGDVEPVRVRHLAYAEVVEVDLSCGVAAVVVWSTSCQRVREREEGAEVGGRTVSNVPGEAGDFLARRGQFGVVEGRSAVLRSLFRELGVGGQ